MNIYLSVSNQTEERLKAYLEQNASEVLAKKINDGVQITKDGVTVINKKDLKGFMGFATKEAQKIAEKGARGACVEDNIVFGWLVHYFEEDSIEGKLYNLDGSEYKPVVKNTAKTKPASTAKPVVKQEPKDTQMSLFDEIFAQTKEEKKEDKMESVVEEIQRNAEMLDKMEEEEQKPVVKETKPSNVLPLYRDYMQLQEQHPDAVVMLRCGDFYEIFGDNAVMVSEEINLTLTSRVVGLPERIPMVGFPYHCAMNYVAKIAEKHNIVFADSVTSFQYLDTLNKKKQTAEEVDDVLDTYEQDKDIYEEMDNLTVEEMDALDKITVDTEDEVDENGEVRNDEYKLVQALKSLLGIDVIVW